MTRELKDSVVVVTGASSGIGRATALAMAKRGAHVALFARRREPLDKLARECERYGVRALVLPTDVTDEAAVKASARAVIDTLGGIDVWVNDAGVLALGQFVDLPPATFRRVMDVNFMGYVHGALAALTHFVSRRSGVIINIASVESVVPFPYFSAYVSAKHAVHGFTRSLRQELRDLGHTDIHVCEILPATIDTPIFQRAANYTGRKARAMPPVYPPERVAQAIVELTERPELRVRMVGGAGRVMRALVALMPRIGERLVARMVEREHLEDAAQSPTNGNVFEPLSEGTGASGGWRKRQRATRSRRIARGAFAGAAVLATVAAGAMAVRALP